MYKNIRNKKKDNFLIHFSFITLFAYQLYGGHFFNQFIVKLSCNILIIFLLFYTYKYWTNNRNDLPFYNIVRTFFFVALCSILMTYIFKGQSIFLTFNLYTRGALQILIFFYLWKTKPNKEILEIYILLFGLIYIILWSYAFYSFPSITFGETSSSGEITERGIARINFVGRGNLILACFLCLNRFKENKKNIWLITSILFFIFVVFQVTRQLILWTFIVSFFHLVWNNKKIICISAIICIILYFFTPKFNISDDSIVGTLLNQTEQQVDNQKAGEDDIRIKEYKFYFTEWHKNPLTFMLGTGIPHLTSEYGKWYARNVQEQMRIFSSDVGYAQMFEIFGLSGLVIFIIIFIKGARAKISSDMTYVRLWFIFMIPANIAAAWYIKSDFMVLTTVCLYLIGLDTMRRKNDNKISRFK